MATAPEHHETPMGEPPGGDVLPGPDADARLAFAIDSAHAHALTAAALALDVEALRWRLHNEDELVALRAELAAAHGELDRLRALPELRIGQRVRHISGRVRRRGDAPETTDEGAPAPTPSSPVVTGNALPHPPLAVPRAVVTVRNRPQRFRATLLALDQLGVVEVDIVDNESSDPHAIALLRSSGRPVHRSAVDLGADSAWASGVIASLLGTGNVLEVAGDMVPAPSCPRDVIDRMVHELDRRPGLDAVELTVAATLSPARFRLLRAGLDRQPATIGVLDAPYVAERITVDPSEPSERYADRVDDRSDG